MLERLEVGRGAGDSSVVKIPIRSEEGAFGETLFKIQISKTTNFGTRSEPGSIRQDNLAAEELSGCSADSELNRSESERSKSEFSVNKLTCESFSLGSHL